MKKITLLLLVWICTMSAFSMRYLVQLGTEGAATWRATGTDETIIDLTTVGQSLDAWFNATVESEDEVWIAKGTYVVGATISISKINLSIFGGFAGSETTVSQRDMDSSGKPWGFINSTVLDGNNAVTVIAAIDVLESNIIDGVTIVHGKANAGGGASIRGGTTIQNSIISNNTANTSGGGVMLWIAGELKNCLIENNTAGSSGGGVFSQNTTASGSFQPLVSGCVIRNNTAKTQGGGGILVGGIGHPTKVINTAIIGNTAITNDATPIAGSAVYTNSASNIFINCLIANNSGRIAIYFNGGEIVNSTIVNNENSIGYNIYFASATNSTKLINTIVWNTDANTPNVAGVAGKHIVLSNNGTYPGIREYTPETDPWTQSNNFVFEYDNNSQEGNKGPGFINPTTFVGIPYSEAEENELNNANWDIKPTSGAINKGIAHAEVASDLLGRMRLVGGINDIGAYEYSVTSGVNTAYRDLSYDVYSVDRKIIINGLIPNQDITLFSVNGIKIFQNKSTSNSAIIEVPVRGVYILKINHEIGKVIIR